MQNVTVVVLTKNEEQNIVDVVGNSKKLTPNILVIDSGSTDGTVALAEKYGANVQIRAWDDDYSAQRNFALDFVKTDWVLYLDADERMDDELVEEIKKILANNRQALYSFVRKSSAFGKDFNYGVLGLGNVIRLFPTKMIKWVGAVHEGVQSNLPIVKIYKGFIMHYTYSSVEQYLEKMNKYSSIGAEDRKKQGKKVTVIFDLVFRPIFAFFKMYILKGGFLEGWLGFMLCVNYANYTFNKYVKLKMME